ncbi:MAG: hypothetical protein PHV30_10460 [Candidatus Margulisbacteria bacterium]|nr:hypothetical protein [Candidatus Margulisiibacteriota bacterium]
MTNTLFVNLCKYTPGKDIDPEENFITEALVYMIKYSLDNGTDLSKRFINLLGANINDLELSSCLISSQTSFKTKRGDIARPDITIEFPDKYILVEVKVNAQINMYSIEDNSETSTINQLEKYSDIKVEKEKYIVLLSKNFVTDLKGCNKSLSWQKVYEILKIYRSEDKIEAFLIEQFKKLMEVRQMVVGKVGYEFENGVRALVNLMGQLNKVIAEIKIGSYKSQSASYCLGFHLLKNNKEAVGWIGIYYDHPERIAFELYNEKLKQFVVDKGLKENFTMAINNYYDYFYFEQKRYYCLTTEEQVEEIKSWARKTYELIKEFF